MKKVFLLIMVIAIMFCATSCGKNKSTKEETISFNEHHNSTTSEESQNNSDSIKENSKSIVVYFSCTGNTKNAAEKIAGLICSDIYEIQPKTPYTNEDLDYNNDDCRANKEMSDTSARPAISGDSIDLSSYDTVFIGYPIWWDTMPRIINTFLDTYDLSDKVIMPFCTSGSSGISFSVSDIQAEEPNADIKEGLRINALSDNTISNWLKQNGF